MSTYKSFKWGYGVVAILSLGVSSCYMDNQDYRPMDTHSNVIVRPVAPHPKLVEKKASGGVSRSSAVVREPVQQVAPGPKRTAAPSLPVIQ